MLVMKPNAPSIDTMSHSFEEWSAEILNWKARYKAKPGELMRIQNKLSFYKKKYYEHIHSHRLTRRDAPLREAVVVFEDAKKFMKTIQRLEFLASLS